LEPLATWEVLSNQVIDQKRGFIHLIDGTSDGAPQRAAAGDPLMMIYLIKEKIPKVSHFM
jgi:hypothetical protein